MQQTMEVNSCFQRRILLLLALFVRAVVGQDTYIVFSQPKMRWIGYVKLPDPTPRTLVNSGLVWPTGITIDYPRMKLYVTDKTSFKVFWYQLIVLPGGKLVTDGQQHVAVTPVQANMLTTDSVGDLYWTGIKLMMPPFPPEGPGVFKHPTLALLSGNTLVDGTLQYDRSGTDGSWNPTSVITDGSAVWWGNGAGAPPGKGGAVVKNGGKIADNMDDVTSLVLTPKYIFYAGFRKTETGGSKAEIWGIPKEKAGMACGEHCKLIADELSNPTGMVWDGDGTVYVCDHGDNSIWTFPSGALMKKRLTPVVRSESNPMAYDIDLVMVPSSGGAIRRAHFASFAGGGSLLVLALVMLLTTLYG